MVSEQDAEEPEGAAVFMEFVFACVCDVALDFDVGFFFGLY